MAKKKSKKTASAARDAGHKEAVGVNGNAADSVAKLFTALQEKGAAWYGREREGIALIEGFQSALLAVRDAQAAATVVAERDEQSGEVALAGLAGNAAMDPWLAEDLYQQVQELSSGFEELLEHMYALLDQARQIVLGAAEDGQEQQVEATQLRPVDYLQMMSQELATFEAEYQHIEALLRLISFETSTDELRTLVISWSTSPFLDPAQSRSFLQRHQISQQQHA
ncbi:uncharacterized protein IUM83_13204 [Phytophthora cinnamomi]|uniref:uncharacterized protein n=1 Tax=Phytophthora cinnamomi TaxID=4785 RepID=UPI00355A5F42|nr:hypothetical protein IUM83_13204 [Phytophthora cinnamomi]